MSKHLINCSVKPMTIIVKGKSRACCYFKRDHSFRCLRVTNRQSKVYSRCSAKTLGIKILEGEAARKAQAETAQAPVSARFLIGKCAISVYILDVSARPLYCDHKRERCACRTDQWGQTVITLGVAGWFGWQHFGASPSVNDQAAGGERSAGASGPSGAAARGGGRPAGGGGRGGPKACPPATY